MPVVTTKDGTETFYKEWGSGQPIVFSHGRRNSRPIARKFIAICRAGPFYGYNRPGAKTSEPIIQNWWRQGDEGGRQGALHGIVAFSQTDFTEDVKKITLKGAPQGGPLSPLLSDLVLDELDRELECRELRSGLALNVAVSPSSIPRCMSPK